MKNRNSEMHWRLAIGQAISRRACQQLRNSHCSTYIYIVFSSEYNKIGKIRPTGQ